MCIENTHFKCLKNYYRDLRVEITHLFLECRFMQVKIIQGLIRTATVGILLTSLIKSPELIIRNNTFEKEDNESLSKFQVEITFKLLKIQSHFRQLFLFVCLSDILMNLISLPWRREIRSFTDINTLKLLFFLKTLGVLF